MDAGPIKSSRARWRPEGCNKVAMVLQGGGALGAYQAGSYQALHEAGLEPDWIAGVSIGAINGAIIAGNPPERRLDRLRAFWDLVTSRPTGIPPDGDGPRAVFSAWSSLLTMTLGQPGFFSPYYPGPWFSPRGTPDATSFYDSAPLRETLLRLVDFDLINARTVRYAVGAVNVASGNFAYFDNARGGIAPEHVMASAALPPALPMVQVGTDLYWDGGVVSNTPLQHLLEHNDGDNMLVFQLDLFSARGPVPRDMLDVLGRQKDIQYSSRTRLVTDTYRRLREKNTALKKLLAKLPDEALDDEERELKRLLAHLPSIVILHLIYQQSAYEGAAKDYDFSAASMREHWESGYRDTSATLQHRDWLQMPSPDSGIVVHDVHRQGG
jgi:NTE family protein